MCWEHIGTDLGPKGSRVSLFSQHAPSKAKNYDNPTPSTGHFPPIGISWREEPSMFMERERRKDPPTFNQPGKAWKVVVASP